MLMGLLTKAIPFNPKKCAACSNSLEPKEKQKDWK